MAVVIALFFGWVAIALFLISKTVDALTAFFASGNPEAFLTNIALLIIWLGVFFIVGGFPRNLEAAKFHVFERFGKRFVVEPGLRLIILAKPKYTLPGKDVDDRGKLTKLEISAAYGTGEQDIWPVLIKRAFIPNIAAAANIVQEVGDDPEKRHEILCEEVEASFISAFRSYKFRPPGESGEEERAITPSDLQNPAIRMLILQGLTKAVNAELQSRLEDRRSRLWHRIEVGIGEPKSLLKKIAARKEEGKAEGDFLAGILEGLSGLSDEKKAEIIKYVAIGSAISSAAKDLLSAQKSKGRTKHNRHGREEEGGGDS